MVKDLSNEIYAYALENAVTHGNAIPNAILPKLFLHGLNKKNIKDIMPVIGEIVKEVNALSQKDKESKLNYYRRFLKEKVKKEAGLKELQNTKKKMVFRMAPFPS